MRRNNRRQSGFVVLFLAFGLLKIGSVEARNPVPEELQYLEEPDRGEWQMPERVIETLKLRKSDVVADVGAGTGYFSRRFAPQVAHVYAEDIDPEALSFLRKEALANVTVVPGKPENPMLFLRSSARVRFRERYPNPTLEQKRKMRSLGADAYGALCIHGEKERTTWARQASTRLMRREARCVARPRYQQRELYER
jgi:SAM-dependent methyltransferase